jgi:O-antigen/teichoic acid export membrane protein
MQDPTERLGQMLRNLAALGAGNYGAMAMSLVINALLTRRLGAEPFGQLTLLLMASQVGLMLAANWTQTGLIRFGAQEFAARGTVADAFWTRIWVVAPWALAGMVGVLLARGPLSSYLRVPVWGLSIVVAHFAASFVLLTVGGVFQARNEMAKYGAALFLDKATMAALLVLPFVTAQSPLTLLAMYAICSTAVAVWGLIALRGALWPPRWNLQAYRALVAFSIPLVVSSWVGLLGTNWIDFVVIKWYRPLSDVGSTRSVSRWPVWSSRWLSCSRRWRCRSWR